MTWKTCQTTPRPSDWLFDSTLGVTKHWCRQVGASILRTCEAFQSFISANLWTCPRGVVNPSSVNIVTLILCVFCSPQTGRFVFYHQFCFVLYALRVPVPLSVTQILTPRWPRCRALEVINLRLKSTVMGSWLSRYTALPTAPRLNHFDCSETP